MATAVTRRGLATEAAAAVTAWARGQLGVHHLTMWAGRENTASRRVAEHLGFRRVGPVEHPVEGGMGPFEADRHSLD